MAATGRELLCGPDYVRDQLIYVAEPVKSFSSYSAFGCWPPPRGDEESAALGLDVYLLGRPKISGQCQPARCRVRINQDEGNTGSASACSGWRSLGAAKALSFEVENENSFPLSGSSSANSRRHRRLQDLVATRHADHAGDLSHRAHGSRAAALLGDGRQYRSRIDRALDALARSPNRAWGGAGQAANRDARPPLPQDRFLDRDRA